MSAGSYSFLFTDLEGSTGLWEQQPERMSAAMARHDMLLRQCVTGAGGTVVKMSGDGVHAVFVSATEALVAALEIQRALADSAAVTGIAMRVRSAVHTGPAESRDGDYYGTTVNRAARLANAAHGGQIIVSEAALEGALHRLPADTALRELGRVRLRDLSEPARVYQLLHPELTDKFPPLRSLESAPNNLPLQLTSFIGHRDDIAEVRRQFDSARLVTLVGAGGIGKSRLSLQIGASLIDRHADGVWFVELAPIAEPAEVVRVIADTLGVREVAGQSRRDTLIAHLKTRALLLILDNCEHVIDAAARVADQLLRAAPRLAVLATSREVLRIDGEFVHAVPALAANEAVQLFAERARFQSRGFAIGADDAGAVAGIVARLDGIPLAIELAAAQIRAMPAHEILAQLDDRFRLLTGGSRVALPRQQTLRALVDWSFDLLTDPERAVFMRLAVFVGGCTIEAACAVCHNLDLAGDGIPAIVERLHEKSLLVRAEVVGTARYGFLETIHEYARDRLETAGKTGAAALSHAAWFGEIAANLSDLDNHTAFPAECERLEPDAGNLRAALHNCLDLSMDPPRGLALSAALLPFWRRAGNMVEARQFLESALAHPANQAPGAIRARAHYGAALTAYFMMDLDIALAHAERAAAMFEDTDDLRQRALSHSAIAYCRYVRDGHAVSAPFFKHAIEIAAKLGQRRECAQLLANYSNNCLHVGEIGEARETSERAREINREFTNPAIDGMVNKNFGIILMGEGKYAEAARLFDKYLQCARVTRDAGGEGAARFYLASALGGGGRIDQAVDQYHASIRLLAQAGIKLELLNALESFCGLMAVMGHAETACRVLAATEAERARAGTRAGAAQQAARKAAIDPARAALGEAAYAAIHAEAGKLSLETATQLALAVNAPKLASV